MTIYEISSDKFCKIDEISFSSAGLRERQDLQRLLRSQIEIVAPDTLVISEEFTRHGLTHSRRKEDNSFLTWASAHFQGGSQPGENELSGTGVNESGVM